MLEEALTFMDSLFSPLVGEFYADFMTAGIMIVLFFFLAKLVNFILKRFVLHVSSKTDTELDDLIVDAISLPLIIGIVVIGLFIGIQGLPALAAFGDTINLSFSIFYILFSALIAIRVINAVVYWYATRAAHKTKTKVDDQFLPIIRRVILGVVLLFALMAILGVFGVELTAAIAALGVGGIAIALALQDTLSEFFAGGHVILDRPITIGDFIELDSGDRGRVTDIGWRSTTIKTWEGNYVVLPNSMIANSKLINFDKPKQELGFVVDVGVGYHEDLERVEKVTLDVANKVMKTLDVSPKGFEPVVRYAGFGDSNIDFRVVLRVKNFSDRFLLRHEFIKALKKRYDKEGIKISWPVRKVYQHKGKGK